MSEPRMATTPAAVIHLLTKSRTAACGKLKGEPPVWPAGHLWVRVSRAYMVNCPSCLRLVPEVRGDPPEK